MASQADRILRLIIMGVDDFTPTMNRLNGSLTNTGRTYNSAVGGMHRQTGLLNEQLRILRRTAEYAISGAAIYQIFKAMQTYKQFRSELGVLNANLMTTGRNLEAIGDSAVRVAARSVSPIQDILKSYQNIAATFPNISRKLIPVFSEIEAKTAKIMQTEPQTVGATIGQLATAFYGRNALNNPKTGSRILGKIGSELITTLFRTPRTTGQDLTSYLPMLAGGAVTAGFTLPQMLSLFTVSQRSLGRPSQTAQYLRQLFIRLKAPTKAEQPFFAQAGLGPATLTRQTGMQSLTQLIRYGIGLGASINGKHVTFEQAQASGFKGLKLDPKAADFFRKAIGGRIQSLVAITSLVRNFGQIAIEEQKQISDSTDALNKKWDAWLNQNRMSEAANNFSLLTLSLINDLNPVIMKVSELAADLAGLGIKANKGLKGAAGYINSLLGDIPGVGKNASRFHIGGALEIAGGVAAILAARKSGIGGVFKKLPGLRRGATGLSPIESVLGAAIRGPLDIQAAASALTNQANGSPTAPFWVVIHPLSAQTVPGMFGKGTRIPGGGIKTGEDLAKKLEKAGIKTAEGTGAAGAGAAVAKRRTLSAAVRRGAAIFGRRALAGIGGTTIRGGALGPVGIAIGVLTSDGTVVTHPGLATGMVPVNTGGGYYRNVRKGSIFDLVLNQHRMVSMTPALIQAEMQWGKKLLSDARFKQMLLTATPANVSSVPHSGVVGAADINATFFLQPTEELKKLLKPQKVAAKVPTKLWGNGSPAPTTRARPTTRNDT